MIEREMNGTETLAAKPAVSESPRAPTTSISHTRSACTLVGLGRGEREEEKRGEGRERCRITCEFVR